MAQQGSTEQRLAEMTENDALASRLEMLAESVRAFSPQQRHAYLMEAAKRLRWPDSYEKHLSRYQEANRAR